MNDTGTMESFTSSFRPHVVFLFVVGGDLLIVIRLNSVNRDICVGKLPVNSNELRTVMDVNEDKIPTSVGKLPTRELSFNSMLETWLLPLQDTPYHPLHMDVEDNQPVLNFQKEPPEVRWYKTARAYRCSNSS